MLRNSAKKPRVLDTAFELLRDLTNFLSSIFTLTQSRTIIYRKFIRIHFF